MLLRDCRGCSGLQSFARQLQIMFSINFIFRKDVQHLFWQRRMGIQILSICCALLKLI